MARSKATQKRYWNPSSHRRKRGFEATGNLVSDGIRNAGEARGFAVARLLTHWADIVGPDLADVSRPVQVGFGRSAGLGATLTVLTTGPYAPLLQMQEPQIREKVNACYGYGAISRIKITQTAPTGFAEGQVAFTAKPQMKDRTPTPKIAAEASALAGAVSNPELRDALAKLGAQVLEKAQSPEKDPA